MFDIVFCHVEFSELNFLIMPMVIHHLLFTYNMAFKWPFSYYIIFKYIDQEYFLELDKKL